MLLPSIEFALMGAVLALYLYDSAILLHANEGILSPVGRDRWQVGFGSGFLQWQGKEVFLPNPFTPHRPVYRLPWTATGVWAPLPIDPPPRSFGCLVWLTWAMAGALFVLLPLGLFSRFGDLSIVAALVCFYGAALSAFGHLWRQRDRFQCRGMQFARLAFESLTCPPFALNLIRHLSMSLGPAADLAHAARSLQTGKDWEDTRRLLIERLENDTCWVDDGLETAVRMRKQIAALKADHDDPGRAGGKSG